MFCLWKYDETESSRRKWTEFSMSEDWSRIEVEATVADYLAMYRQELHGEVVNKAAHNRHLLTLLNNRSRGAVEFKHANISAALIDLGYPYIEGYKPRQNYQALLVEVLREHLTDSALQAITLSAVDQLARVTADVVDYTRILVPAPVRDIDRRTWKERRQPLRQPRFGVNYLEREAKNISLGQAGEEFIVRFEHHRLWNAGQKQLAERIEHVSANVGDGLGYDIHSFEEDGRDRLIEVKTTRFGVMTPFFVSRNEVEVSQEAASRYHLFRVFNFRTQAPKLYTLPGSLRQSCLLDPVQYEASVF